MSGLPAGVFRVRALDLFGHVTFASGVSVREGSVAGPVRLWAKVDLDEPDIREVIGFVRWESGLPVRKAAVFLQNSNDFRRYVRRVETDEHGFFRFSEVPGDESYFVFALPPGDDDAMRNFEYFSVTTVQREVWRPLTLHPHRVTGDLPAAVLAARRPGERGTLQFVRLEGKAEQLMWTFRAEPSGKFTVANVPHGRYCVQVRSSGGDEVARSLPFEVAEGQEEVVRWPESVP